MTTSEFEIRFQQGVGGYLGTADTMIRQSAPGTSYSNATSLEADGDSPGGTGRDDQALLTFAGLIGSGSGQIPIGATIVSASLKLQTTNGSEAGARFHRMLTPWSEASTWSTLVDGVKTDGTEAVATADLVTGKIVSGTSTFNVTASVQAWANGASNLGWVFTPSSGDGWAFSSSEGFTPPELIVRYTVGDPPGNTAPTAQNDSARVTQDQSVTVSVLANDSDPDGDTIGVTGIARAPSSGTAVVNPNGTITYTPFANFFGQDSFDYQISDGHGGTASAAVGLIVEASQLSASHIATTISSGRARLMEHTNSGKSFYHDDTWWAVLPDGNNWSVHRFTGAWTKASSDFKNNNHNADIAWDDVNDRLYVLNYGKDLDNPTLFKLKYNWTTDTWQTEASIQIGGVGGKLSGSHWNRNNYLSLGLDQDGNPLISAIGGAVGTAGLRVAYANTKDLASWSEVTLDSDTTASGASSRADFVTFSSSGLSNVAIVYSSDSKTSGTLDAWKIAHHTTGTSYSTGWNREIVNTSVKVDDHISVVSDGSTIYFSGKDAFDTTWVFSGAPHAWENPVKVVTGPSRPTLVLDDSNDDLFVFFQQATNGPTGDIFMKRTDTDNLTFDSSSLGVRVLESDSESENMYDPQLPVHNVGADTNNKFFVFAKNFNTNEIWYSGVPLGSDIVV